MASLNFIGFVGVVLLVIHEGLACPRTPIHLPHGRRSRGDNGYKLIIGDNPTGYAPGRTYNLLLLGSRTHTKVQHFTHFKITVEAVEGSNRPTVASPKRVGNFLLFGDSLTKFNDRCVNTVSEADDLPKTEIQVMWTAPAPGSGCVSFSVMVYENQNSWFADDGELSKVLCEKKADVETAKKECCACDEAKYNFIFEGIWSNETHPKDYPFAVWLTHFSDVIGASHDANFSFWGEHHIATDGFRSLAEWGSPTALEAELRTKGPRLRTLVKAAGLWYPHVNSNTSAHFRVDRKHHKVSLVSMFGPSPDWVVGISGVDLCTQECSWTDSLDFDLYPWDAGTDNGISYMSPNDQTQPRERMYRITTMYPEDPRAPFYNPNSKDMIPLAKLYIRKEKTIPRNCDDDFLEALQLDVSENTEDENIRPECEVTEYTEWSPCSVTCGKGLRMRTREYKNSELAHANDCNRQLVSKEMCVSSIPECEETNDDDDEGENLAKSQSLVNEDGEGVGVCATTPWSDWSECSSTCGIGITMRTRTFLNHLGRKRCPHVTIVEKQKCMKPDCTFEQEELPDPLCPVTQWSDWSPCTATCGKGVTIRSRLLLLEPALRGNCTTRIQLNEQKECTVRDSCQFSFEMASQICREQADPGPCRAAYDRFAYNERIGKCERFVYGGCKGNRNNFITEQHCLDSCRILQSQKHQEETTEGRPTVNESRSYVVDCKASDWTSWSQCSVSCGTGVSVRYRQILEEPRNGGEPCPKRTVQRKRCYLPNCTP